MIRQQPDCFRPKGEENSPKFPIGVVVLASNSCNRSSQATDWLMLFTRNQGTITIPTRVCADKSNYDFELNLNGESINLRAKHFCVDLVSMTTKLGGNNVQVYLEN